MNALDLLVVGLAAGAGWVGFRIGFVRRAFSWAGLAIGLVVAVLFVSDIADMLKSSPPRTRLLVSLGFVLLVVTIAQAHRHRARLLPHDPARGITRRN